MCAISDYLHALAVCQLRFRLGLPRDWYELGPRWRAMSSAQREYISVQEAMGPNTRYTDPLVSCYPPLRPRYRAKLFAMIESLQDNGDA